MMVITTQFKKTISWTITFIETSVVSFAVIFSFTFEENNFYAVKYFYNNELPWEIW